MGPLKGIVVRLITCCYRMVEMYENRVMESILSDVFDFFVSSFHLDCAISQISLLLLTQRTFKARFPILKKPARPAR